MDTTAYVALSRQVALMREMTVLANNVANIGTTGFRAERTLFDTVLRRAGAAGEVAFVQDVGTAYDLRPGPLAATGSPLDIAIDGDGWLAFATSDGTGYSRGGRLQRAPDGTLTDSTGRPLLDDAGAPIAVPTADGEISIAADGTVSTRAGQIGRIGLASFTEPRALRPRGDGLWASAAAPLPSTARVVQGMLEGSNVEPVLEMTRLIETTRAFEGTQRLIETHHDLERRAVERLLAAA
jgi:flagellar basal-body rod protein FlgF